ncbi:Transient receptor potential cation channel subfamily M member 6 [Exaiptasia diaphana]|nr:Transient receptor potential cation channel subfamily M member 6 [Exaiptasia diaphana]
MVYCSVSSCKNGNYKQPDIGYFRFPKQKERLDVWLKFCNRNDRNFRKNSRRAKAGKENYLRICSDHFPSDALHKTLGGKWVLKADSNPIHSHDLIENKERKTAGEKRGFRPDKDEVEEAITFKSPRPSSDECFSSSTGFTSTDDPLLDHTYCLKTTSYTDTSTKIPGKTSTATQTDLNHEEIRIMEEEIIKLKKENDELSKKINNKSALKRELFIEDVLKSDESVKFYTGVPSKDYYLLLLLSIHESEAKKLKYWDKSTSKSKTMFYEKTDKKKPGPRRTLSLLLEFVMTLVRLRLGLTQKHLSDIFAISESQVCRITLTWICFLSSSLRETLLLWPSKENIRRKLPRSFKDYPNTRVIIDCREMFVEKPSSPYAQKATWSEYKQYGGPSLSHKFSDRVPATLENFVSGDFHKFVNNDGVSVSPPTDDVEEVYEKAQCFVHYSYQFSQKKFMVLDIQGTASYILYDPEIATSELYAAGDGSENRETYFCAGNLSFQGIEKFQSDHICNKFCNMLNLDVF